MADGIPYPQAPQYNVPNPLQTMQQMQAMSARGVEMERAEQTMEQQRLTFAGKQALGAIMQKHINPETGQFDDVKAFGDFASHPELSPIMSDVMEQMLRIPGIKAQALEQQLSYKSKQLAHDSELAAAAVRQAEAGNADMRSIATDYVSKRLAAGTIDSKEAAALTQHMVQLAKNPADFRRALYQSAQFGEAAQKSLDNAGMGLGQMLAMKEYYDQQGLKRQAPAYMVPGALSPQQQELAPMGQRGAGSAAVGSSAELPVRQGESPSTPSAAPYEGLALERTPEMEQRKAFISDTKGEHWLRKDITEAEREATVAAEAETKMLQQMDLLRQFEQGPGMDTRARLAETARALNMPESIVNSLVGAKPGSKDSVAAMQAARKHIFEMTTSNLRENMPGSQRFTNFDLQSAQKATPDLSMTKEGTNIIMGHLQNAINIAKERAKVVGQYADWSVENAANSRAFKQHHLEDSVRKWLTHSGLLRTGPIDVTKKPGEK
jgi:hypothetical protein